jgi:membrane protease YdiL (CAAX protease family)
MIMTDEPRKTAWGSGGQVLVAWILLLFAGDFYTIFVGTQPAWFAVLQAVVLVAVAGAFSFNPRLKPLRGFAIALAALDAGDFVRWTAESHLPWLSGVSLPTQMFIDALLAGIPALLMLATAVYSGLTLRQVFLVRGNMRAFTSFPLLRSARWTLVAPLIFLVTATPLAGRLRILGVPGKMSSLGFFGVAFTLAFAAINAGFEEIRFRCVLLARAEGVVGRTHAIWLTAVLFGLAHWGPSNHPNGLIGAAMTGFLGWLLATSILDTRGWGWAWLIHLGDDVIIFLSILANGQ